MEPQHKKKAPGLPLPHPPPAAVPLASPPPSPQTAERQSSPATAISPRCRGGRMTDAEMRRSSVARTHNLSPAASAQVRDGKVDQHHREYRPVSPRLPWRRANTAPLRRMARNAAPAASSMTSGQYKPQGSGGVSRRSVDRVSRQKSPSAPRSHARERNSPLPQQQSSLPRSEEADEAASKHFRARSAIGERQSVAWSRSGSTRRSSSSPRSRAVSPAMEMRRAQQAKACADEKASREREHDAQNHKQHRSRSRHPIPAPTLRTAKQRRQQQRRREYQAKKRNTFSKASAPPPVPSQGSAVLAIALPPGPQFPAPASASDPFTLTMQRLATISSLSSVLMNEHLGGIPQP